MNKFKELYLKNKPKIIITVSVALILLAVINIYLTFTVRTTSNDECLWNQKPVSGDSTAIYISNVKVDGVTWNAGIRDGDELLAIDNKIVHDPTSAQIILNKFSYGQYADYTIKKKDSGKIIHTEVFVKKLIQIGNLSNEILALIWMIIGFIVLMAKSNGRVQKLFFAIGVFAVLATFNNFFPTIMSPADVSSQPWKYLVILICYSAGIGFLPFLFVNFFWSFPVQFGYMDKKIVRKTLIILPVVFSLSILITTVLFYRQNKLNVDSLMEQRKLIGYVSYAGYLIAFVSLFIHYVKLKTKEARKPVIIILIAFLVAILAIIYALSIAPAISDTVFNSPEYYTPIILIVLVPIAFAYSIFKYQLLDVSVVVKNTVMYGTATAGIAAIYFFVIYVLGQGISSAIGTQFQSLLAGLIFIAFAVVFQSTKDRFQDFLTARFYPEQFAYQKVLIKFGNEVATVVGRDNILDSMKDTFVDALKINHLGIFLKNKEDDNYTLAREVGISDRNLIIENDKLQNVVAQKSLIEKHVVIERNEFKEVFPVSWQKLEQQGIFTVLPMIVKSKMIGLLLFGLKHSGAQFAGKDLELLFAAASQASIAIENARLYQTEAEKLKMERDLDLARKIQQGLLPKCVPDMKGLDICGEMVPAMQVGGDYFDYIPVSDTQLFIVVGDVSGKGLSAALYMTKLQTMIQLACTKGKSPKEVLIDINKRLYESIERNWFVTMTLALFDLEKNTMAFCRAGHVPLLIAENGTIVSHRSRGLGVGLEKGVIFADTLVEEKLQIKPGQIFGFFSDGITEAMNKHFDLFGEERISGILKNKTSLKSTEIMDQIWLEIKTFRGDFEQNDDMTVVLVKVN